MSTIQSQDVPIYDRPDFYAGYSKLPRSVNGLASALEWPVLRQMLGDISNLNILDLGCGFGYFCRWALHEAGAQSVHGVDVSARMLEHAKKLDEETSSEKHAAKAVSYSRADLETVELEAQSYDVVYSSLALHYLPSHSLHRLVDEAKKTLVPGGRFVFSVEHPIFTAPRSANVTFQASEQGSRIWPLDSYADQGPRERNWLADGVIKQHRTVEAYVTCLLDAGFVLNELKEWMPSIEYVKENLKHVGERDRPLFLLIAAELPR